jgi:hypothetical protein
MTLKQLWGGILIAVGILIAGASGLCSLNLLFESDTYASASWNQFGSMLLLVLMFGGPPFALGVALVFGGARMSRKTSDEQEGRPPGGE